MIAPDRAWLESLRAAALAVPSRPRVPLRVGGIDIGSVEPELLSQIAVQPNICKGFKLLKEEHIDGQHSWNVLGDVTQSLNEVAVLLHQAGLAGAWRDEQLAVVDALGRRLGSVERAAVRPLGISSQAVHLVGQAPDGRFWVQQRAFDKPSDPGLWDTMVGGMVPSSDTLETALARETWEEAGLHVADLHGMRYGGMLMTARPSSDGAGHGYLRERLDWYGCTVPAGLVPENQDGEVEQFRLLEPDTMLADMQRGKFTLEAALIYAQFLGLL